MPHGRRHVQAYLAAPDHWRLRREAAARGATISKCVADCLHEYFALCAELATAVDAPGQPGEPHRAGIIHSLLARSEERLVATLDQRTRELLGEVRLVQTMLDRLAVSFFVHTPEVAPELRDGALVSANRRYGLWRRAVERVDRGSAGNPPDNGPDRGLDAPATGDDAVSREGNP